jgi:hypothetical protein
VVLCLINACDEVSVMDVRVYKVHSALPMLTYGNVGLTHLSKQ